MNYTTGSKRIKKWLLLALAAVLMLAMAACSGSKEESAAEEEPEQALTDWEYVQDNGVLRVGYDSRMFVPMTFVDANGEFTGYDVDLARAISDEMGVDVEFIAIDWNSMENELSSGNIDCVWGGLSATEERQESLSLSKSYFNNRIVIMNSNEGVDMKSSAELAFHLVGVQAGSGIQELIQTDASYASYSGNIAEYATYDAAIEDMQQGVIDTLIIDEAYGYYLGNTVMPLYISSYSFADNYYAVGFRKQDSELTARFNDALLAIAENGKLAEINTKWFGSDLAGESIL